MSKSYRFYVRTPDGERIFGFDAQKAADTAALEYGDGALLIDTIASMYQPMVQEVRDSKIVVHGVSGWDIGKRDVNGNLIEAIKHGTLAVVEAFRAKGADVNAADRAGGSALHWATGAGKADIVDFLLGHGADPGARDGDGETPLEIARQKNFEPIIGLLEQALKVKPG